MQRVMQGRGYLDAQHVRELMEQLGMERPLLVCGARMQQVFCARTGMTLPTFSAYHSNPDLMDCAAGAEMYREHGCDSLISLGGGSAMDTAKGVKAMLLCDDLEAVQASRLPAGKRLPHLAIPATAGTGAEATPIAVVYVKDSKLSLDHPVLLPEGVLLDGSLLDTLPEYHRKACAMDALCQGIESWWAGKATDESRAHAGLAIRGVMQNLTAYLAGDEDAQEAMLNAAFESGCAIRISRTTAAHAMSYQITKQIGPAHGHACILTLPHLWRHLAQDGRHEVLLAGLAEQMGLAEGEDAPLLLQGMIAALGLEIREMPDAATLDALTASVNTQRLGNHPEPLTAAQLREIYVQAFTPMQEKNREEALALWRQYGR